MKEMISVIVPVYNVKEYLDQCITSIINQTYTNLEIILVDDGSNDGSSIICDEWKNKDQRISVIHQENQGLSAARNSGIEYAKGEFIGFVDSDDYIHERMYEFLMSALIKNEAEVAICGERAFFNNENSIFEKYEEYHEMIIEDNEAILQHYLDEFRGPFTWVWNKLYRRDVLSKQRFIKGKKMEDIFFCADVFSNLKRCVWISEKLYGYRQRESSIMNSNDEDVLICYGEAMLYEINKLKNHGNRIFQEKHITYCLMILGRLETEAYWKNKRIAQKDLRNMFLKVYGENRKYVHDKRLVMKISVVRYMNFIYHTLKKEVT